MKKKILAGFAMLFLLFGMTGFSQAALTTIGIAQFGGTGTEYNLIWDDDNNGNSVVWLDFIKSRDTWVNQKSWAAGLGSVLSYNIDSTYSVDWGSNPWRLPNTVDGLYEYSYNGTTTAGYNITNSEMGHLYYTELGNLGYYDTSGDVQSDYGLKEKGDFNNLINTWYWSDTEYPRPFGIGQWNDMVWTLDMASGSQGIFRGINNLHGLALRTGTVSAVPVPGAVWLLGSGIIGLAGLCRRKIRDGV